MITRFTFIAFCSLLFLTVEANAQLDVMTYNLRYATESDGENAWSKRKADVASLINFYMPEILGVQEATDEQITYLDSTFTKYAYVGIGRDDAATKGEYSAILYDSTLLTCIASETFWLSETPNRPSFGWGANFRRICTYGSFEEIATGDTVHVFNAHFDHEVKLARLNGAKVILDRIAKKGLLEKQVVLMGDFNCEATDPPMRAFQTMFELGIVASQKEQYGPTGTFSGFNTQAPLEARTIDHILVRNLEVESYRHIDDRRPNGLWPSDHLPVLATTRSL